MRTEVEKELRWGFVLTEQDLRRIFQTCIDHVEKLALPDFKKTVSVRLRDGSLIESDLLDDVFTIENTGSKAIERLVLSFSGNTTTPEWSILIQFQCGNKNQKSWTSIDLKIISDSRDWAFVTASDLEERIKKVRKIPWGYLMSREYLLPLVLVLAMFIGMSFSFRSIPHSDTGALLEAQYKAGKVANATEALIIVYKDQDRCTNDISPLRMIGTMIVPMLVIFLVIAAVPRLSKPYIFYWGDYIQPYNRRRTVLQIFWTVVVLGLVVSVVAGLILRIV